MLRFGHQSGQASIELLALVPVAAAVALAIGQLLAAGAARQAAGGAAQAAAMSLIQGGDPVAAGRAAAPRWSRDRLKIAVHGRRVEVRLSPVWALPGLADALSAVQRADAGPAS